MEEAKARVFDEPVWYAPLRSPSWLMPPVRDDAARVVFSAATLEGDDPALRGVRVGLPLYLAEAVRFVSDAATTAVVDPAGERPEIDGWAARASTDVVGDGPERRITVSIGAPGPDAVEEVIRGASGDDGLESSIGLLPGAVARALAPLGVRAVWSTVYATPSPGHAAEQIRAHALVGWLLDPEVHRSDPTVDAEEAARKRATVASALSRLAELAARSTSPFNAFLFFAGLLAVRDAGSGVYLDFRLQANALCMNATDARDPVYRMSVLVLRALGDPEIAARRSRSIESDDAAFAAWLSRTEAIT